MKDNINKNTLFSPKFDLVTHDKMLPQKEKYFYVNPINQIQKKIN